MHATTQQATSSSVQPIATPSRHTATIDRKGGPAPCRPPRPMPACQISGLQRPTRFEGVDRSHRAPKPQIQSKSEHWSVDGRTPSCHFGAGRFFCCTQPSCPRPRPAHAFICRWPLRRAAGTDRFVPKQARPTERRSINSVGKGPVHSKGIAGGGRGLCLLPAHAPPTHGPADGLNRNSSPKGRSVVLALEERISAGRQSFTFGTPGWKIRVPNPQLRAV